MKKYIAGLVLLYSTQLFSFDEQAYNRLMQGDSNLVNANLQGAIITDINLTNVDFSRANLIGAQFSNVILQSVTFDQTSLDGARFSDCAFTQCTIRNHTSFNYATFDGTTFNDSDIVDVSFNFLTIQNTDFVNTRITNITINDIAADKGFKVCFIACIMNNIAFVRSRIKGLIIHDTNPTQNLTMDRLDFGYAQLNQCIILGKEATSILSHANFEGTTLFGCFFLNIRFEGCLLAIILGNARNSILKNISSTNEQDIAMLKRRGAKVNGCYDREYKADWDNKPDAFDTLANELTWGIIKGTAFHLGVRIAAGTGCNIQ